MATMLADEDVDGPAIKIARRQFGLDIVRAVDLGLMGMDDPQLFDHAQQHGYIFVTGNFQDYPGVVIDWSQSAREHGGLIIINAQHRKNSVLIARKLVEYAGLNMRNQVKWI